MIWPDFKFGAPQFNEVTFDHWLVVEAVLVPIDSACLAGPFIWELRLHGEFSGAIDLTAVFDWQVTSIAPFNRALDLAATFDWQMNLAAEFKC